MPFIYLNNSCWLLFFLNFAQKNRFKMKIHSRILTILTIVALSSCSPFAVVSDYDKNVSFDSYKTYEIRDNDLEMSDIDKERVTYAVKQNLDSKGLTESPLPDIIVNLKAQHEIIINIKKASDEKKIFLEGYNPVGFTWGWGGPYGAYWGVKWKYRGSPISHRRGGLILDFIDNKSQKLIWQGMGSGINIDRREYKVKQIPKVVNKILNNYPPKQ